MFRGVPKRNSCTIQTKRKRKLKQKQVEEVMAEVVHLPWSLLVYFGRLTVDRVLYLARLPRIPREAVADAALMVA